MVRWDASWTARLTRTAPQLTPLLPLYRAGLPYAEGTWEEAAHVKPLADGGTHGDAAAALCALSAAAAPASGLTCAASSQVLSAYGIPAL